MARFLINTWLHVEVGRSVGPAGHHVLIFAALFDMPVALPILRDGAGHHGDLAVPASQRPWLARLICPNSHKRDGGQSDLARIWHDQGCV